MSGFFAFNGGSMITMQQPEAVGTLGLVVINTLMSASAGGLSAVFCDFFLTEQLSLVTATNGMLSGEGNQTVDLL